jgi:hypothetical protein
MSDHAATDPAAQDGAATPIEGSYEGSSVLIAVRTPSDGEEPPTLE